MSKEALPERYVVDRKGTPDPSASQYYVLDVVHDRHARAALGRLARDYQTYGQTTAAQELTTLLKETSTAHRDVIVGVYEAKNPETAKKAASRRRTNESKGVRP